MDQQQQERKPRDGVRARPGGRGRGGHRNKRGNNHGNARVTEADEPSMSAVLKEPDGEEDVRVQLPGAFTVSFPKVNRVKERGRAFVVPVHGSRVGAAAAHRSEEEGEGEDVSRDRTRVFLVVERTIAGLDDIVYAKHREVWENLPRGNARVFILRTDDDNEGSEGPHARSSSRELEQTLRDLAASGDPRKMLQTVTTLQSTDVALVGAVNGLRKFSYNDKPDAAGKKEDYGYEDKVDAVVALDKENGECGHLSAFTIGQGSQCERYWVTGSKNVHIVLPFRFTEALVKGTYKAKRYGYAVKIALQWKDVMDLAELHHQAGRPAAATEGNAKPEAEELGVDKEAFKNVTMEGLLRFHDLLATHNYTACFEAIFRDSQHLVDYANRNEFRFFALTDNATYEKQVESERPNSEVFGLCVDIQRSFKAFADCGLPTTPIYYGTEVVDNDNFAQLHKIPYNTDAFEALVDAIGHRQNSEGCVMYGYSTTPTGTNVETAGDGGPCRVVKVWKEKSYPYVMERATREAIVNHKLAGKGLEARIKKKLALQKPHIRKYFADWEQTRLPFLVLFSAYLQMTGKLTPHMTRDESFMTIRNHWLSLQREFAAKMESDGELRTVCERFVPGENVTGNEEGRRGGADGAGARTRNMLRLDVIKFVGAQGCGKSTMSRILFFLLAEANFRPRWLNQDEAGNRNNYLAAIKKAIQDAHTVNEKADEAEQYKDRITHLMLDKMNLDQRTNADYNCLPEPAVTVFFTFENEAGEEGNTQESARRQFHMTKLLLSRVMARGSGHRTIKIPDDIPAVQRKQEEQKVSKFLSQAVRACQLPEDDDNLVLVDVTDSLPSQIAQIWSALQENGFYEVPDLDTLHLDLAIEVGMRYEKLLTQQARAPLYAALSVLPTEHDKLLSVVDPRHLVGKKVQNAFHVTTKYFVGDPDPLYFVALAELDGSTMELTLEAVAADEKGVAIRVANKNAAAFGNGNEEGTGNAKKKVYDNDIIAHFLAKAGEPGVVPRSVFPCANAIAHITVANAPGVPPVYSNELLARDPGQPIPGSTRVQAVFTFK